MIYCLCGVSALSKQTSLRVICLLLIGILLNTSIVTLPIDSQSHFIQRNTTTQNTDHSMTESTISNYDEFSSGNFTGVEFSHFNLSVCLDEQTSQVYGNLTVDFYNDDNVPFSRIPFHIYPYGMAYETRRGHVSILNVTTTDTPIEELPFEVSSPYNLMWVNLSEALQPDERTSFRIEFITILPDGGMDRANSHGSDAAQMRIYTFASCYPMPCVYDTDDGWNTDQYVHYGDPFYLDMVFYDFFVEVPIGMTVAGTGNLVEHVSKEANITYHFDPVLPVREVTFSASRYYQVESEIVNGVNVTICYLEDSAPEWANQVLDWTINSLVLFNETYGIYPYSTLNVVEQYALYAGMEFPSQVYVTRNLLENIRNGIRDLDYLRIVVVHEVAHQWWSQIVGVDCIDWGFLDEGLTCWSHNYYLEHYFGATEVYLWYADAVRTFHSENGIDGVINVSNYERHELTGYIDYTKTPMILEKLNLEIGQETFISGLSQFFKQFYFEIPKLSDLQSVMESEYGASLDWFFKPWFNNKYLPDYSFSSVQYNSSDGTLRIIIEDLNEGGSNPYVYHQRVPIRVYGLGYVILVYDEVWINGTTTLSFELDQEPEEVGLIYNNYVLVELDISEPTQLVTRVNELLGEPTNPDNPWIIVGIEAVVVTVFIILTLFIGTRRRKITS